MLNSSPDILIVFPGNLEAITNRGGGREARLLHVALELSRDFTMIIAAPFFGKYLSAGRINSRLAVHNLFFPSSNVYPPRAEFTKLMQLLSTIFYSNEAVVKIIQLRKAGLRVVLLSDFVSGFLPALVARVLDLRVLCYEGNITPWDEPALASRRISIAQAILNALTCVLASVVSKLSDAIVVNDGLIKRGMVRIGVEEEKIFVVRGMVNTKKFRPLQDQLVSKKEFIVGFSGRLTEEKGARLLLGLCETALDKLPRVRFVILGDGKFRESLNALPNIAYLGQVAHNEMCNMLSKADVIVTFQKTFGMGEVEALSCGKPIIAGRVGEMPKLITGEKIGLLCDPDISGYIEAIGMLAENRAFLKELSKKSRMYAVKNCDIATVCRQWKSVVNSLLRKV